METIDRFSTPNGWKFLGTTNGGYFAGKFAPIGGATSEKTDLERRVERDERKAAAAKLPTLAERHAILSAKPHRLTASQNADLLRRGLTQAEVDLCLSKGYLWAEYGGYGIAAIDPETGLIVGGQMARDNRSPKYSWLLPGQTHLLETGQNPLAVWISPNFDPTQPTEIRFCEGFLKSLITALKAWRSDSQVIYIGAAGGNFQDKALERVLSALPSGPMTLYPDAGAIDNPNVMHCYQRLADSICPTVESPNRLTVAWWGQNTKSSPDCDELTGGEEIKILPFWQFAQKTRELQTQTVNQRYLDPIVLPTKPGGLFVSSPTGSGKTEIVEDLLNQFFIRHPDGLADAIGYRNGLLLQTCQRINVKNRTRIVHKFNMDPTSGGWTKAPSIAYCLNSLDQRLEAFHRKIDDGEKVSILLDEVGFIVSHWLEMMKSQPKTGLNFARLLRRIGEGHGYIIGLQANLSDMPISLITEITGKSFPVSIVRNEFQGQPWDVKMVSTINTNGIATNRHAGLGAAQTALKSVQDGKFILCTTSAQEWLERLDTVFSADGFKLLRVDSQTIAAAKVAQTPTPEQTIIRLLFKNPNQAINQARALGCDAIGITPAGDTGISIDDIDFDLQIEYAVSGSSEAVLQRLARDRNNDTPRLVFATDKAADYRADIGTDADQVLRNWDLNSRQGFNAARVFESLDPEQQETYSQSDELTAILTRYAARSVATQNNDRRELWNNIQNRLLNDGHNVAIDEITISPEFRDVWRKSKETIADQNIELYAVAPVIGTDEAREILRSGGTREQIYSAKKTTTLENYPSLDLDNSGLVKRLIFEKRGAALTAITQAWLLKNPAIAQQIDRACWKGQLGRGIVWKPSIRRETLKSQTLADTGILEVIAIDEYCESTPEVIQLRSYCIQNAIQLRRICGYASAFDESHSGIEMVGWILRRLNHKQTVTRKSGARGQQVRHYKAVDLNEGDRTLVEAALELKWQSPEPSEGEDYTIGSHDFSVINPHTKMVTTGVESLSEFPNFDPQDDDGFTFEYIPTDEELREWGIAA